MKLGLTRRQLNYLVGVGVFNLWFATACADRSENTPQTPAPMYDGPAFLYFYTEN